VIGHLKGDHRMGRNYLKGREGDRSNAVLAAAGYNFSLLLRWFEWLLRALCLALHADAPALPLGERPFTVIFGCFCGVRRLRSPQGAQGEITLGHDSILARLRLESHRGASEMRMFFLGMMVAYTPSMIMRR
jgi:hypothetical protein